MRGHAPKRQMVFDFLVKHPEYAKARYTAVWCAMKYPDISFDTICKAQDAYLAWKSGVWSPYLNYMRLPR